MTQFSSRDHRSHDQAGSAVSEGNMKTLALFTVLLMGACATTIPLMDLHLPKNVSASNMWALLVAGSNGYDNYRHQVRCV